MRAHEFAAAMKMTHLEEAVVLQLGPTTAEKLRELGGVAVILEVPPGDEERAIPLLQQGLRAVVRIGAEEEMGIARRAIEAGGVLLPRPLLERLLVQAAPAARQSEPREISLTERESQVLKLLAQGRSNREMSEEMDVALVTVKKYVQSVLAKMGATDRTHAAVLALRLHLVE